MNLPQRMLNTYMYFIHDFFRWFHVHNEMGPLQRKHGLSPDKSFSELQARAQLFIFHGDFGLEYARPLQPNVILISSPVLGQPSEDEVQSQFANTPFARYL